MSRLDIIYLLMLIFCIPLGHLLKNIPNIILKKCMCLIVGLMIVLTLVGPAAVYHSLLMIIFNYGIIKFVSPRYCHYCSFLVVFGYLLFFRCCSYLGYQPPPKHANAVQLLVTLRMVSLAFEKHEYALESPDISRRSMRVVKTLSVSLFDTLVYGYCYIGLMTGPFYSYATFQDMLYQDGSKISTIAPALRNLKLLPILAIPYLTLKKYFPLEYLESPEFLDNEYGFLYSVVIVALTAGWFRIRFYIGWLLAESGCMTASLGAYPAASQPKPGKGPTVYIPTNTVEQEEDAYSFETVENLVVWDVEFGSRLKEMTRDWNKTVQWWLSNYGKQLYWGTSRLNRLISTHLVLYYKMIPFRSGVVFSVVFVLCLLFPVAIPLIRQVAIISEMEMLRDDLRVTVIVFTISAYWHGTYSGYYMMAFLVALYTHLENRCVAAVTELKLNKSQAEVVSSLLHFAVWRFMEFIAVPFMLLKYDKIMRVWGRVNFYGFFILGFLYVLPTLLIAVNGKKSSKSVLGDSQAESKEHENILDGRVKTE